MEEKQSRFRQTLLLTPEERRIVIFIALSLLIGVCVKEYRRTHPGTRASAKEQDYREKTRFTPTAVASPAAATAPLVPRPRPSRKTRRRASPVAKSAPTAPERDDSDLPALDNQPAP